MLAVLLALVLGAPPADLTAVGIVQSRDGAHSVVLLRSGGRTRLAGVGESAFGGKVTAIATDSATVDFDGRSVALRLAGATEMGPLTARGPEPAPDANSRVMGRRDVERRLGEEVPRILAETTITPALNGDRVAGFTLTRVPEGTLLTEAGLRAGDVITAINDTPIDSMATLIGLWPRLQNESTLHATVLRGGQPLTLTVSLR
jgi:type II secretion system protein C